MSNWRPIVLDDLNAAGTSGKVTIILSAATARALPDPSAAAIAAVTQELRAAIGFSGKYSVDQDVTALPSGLIDLAIGRIVRRMAKSVQLALTDDERNDERTYETRLDKIRQGLWPVEAADNPLPVPAVQGSVVLPVTQARPRQFDRSVAY